MLLDWIPMKWILTWLMFNIHECINFQGMSSGNGLLIQSCIWHEIFGHLKFFLLIFWNFESVRVVIGNPSVVVSRLWGCSVFSSSPWFLCWGEEDWVLCQRDPCLSTRGSFNDMHSFAHNSQQMGFSWIIPILSDKEWDGRTEVYFLTSVIHVGVLITWWWWCPVVILVWNLIKICQWSWGLKHATNGWTDLFNILHIMSEAQETSGELFLTCVLWQEMQNCLCPV